jgi:hypothetical protein
VEPNKYAAWRMHSGVRQDLLHEKAESLERTISEPAHPQR